MRKVTVATLLLASAVSIASADVTPTDVEAKYSNKQSVKASQELKQNISLGLANTTGNTKTFNLNGKYLATFTTEGYAGNPLKVAFDAGFFYDKNNGVLSNEEYTANLGLEQYVMDGWLGYAGINWLRNPDFRNYNNKFAIGIGVGKELYNDGQHSFKVKLGTAYNIEDYADATPNKKFGSLNEYLEYNNQLNKVSSLVVKVGAQENFKDFSNDYEITALAGFNFAIADNLSLSIDEEIAYDNLPPVGFKKTDTKSIVRVGYNF